MINFTQTDSRIHLELLPNRSATWKQTKAFVILIGTVVFVIAIAWAFAGAWMILPFAGLEIVLLMYFMAKVSKQTYMKEVLVIDDGYLRYMNNDHKYEWKITNVRLVVYRAEKPLDVCRIFICSGLSRDEYEFDRCENDNEIRGGRCSGGGCAQGQSKNRVIKLTSFKNVEIAKFLNQKDKALFLSHMQVCLSIKYLSGRNVSLVI